MRIDILSLFPEMFEPVLGVSIPGRAQAAGILDIFTTDIRDYTEDKHNKADDRPFGGGPGMVMSCQPVWDAVIATEEKDERPVRRILMSPQGVRLTQRLVEELAGEPRLLIIAGHYKGIDERVIEKLELTEISIGDYVISGGELAAMVLIDGIVRLLPGALGHEDSAGCDSFTVSSGTKVDEKVLLDCPHYTRPRIWQDMEVPEILLTGNHEEIDRWRMQQRLQRTRERRPDLLDCE